MDLATHALLTVSNLQLGGYARVGMNLRDLQSLQHTCFLSYGHSSFAEEPVIKLTDLGVQLLRSYTVHRHF